MTGDGIDTNQNILVMNDLNLSRLIRLSHNQSQFSYEYHSIFMLLFIGLIVIVIDESFIDSYDKGITQNEEKK